MKNTTTTLLIGLALFSLLFLNTCTGGGGCEMGGDDDDDDDENGRSDKCDEFCKNAYFCDLVPEEDLCYGICMDNLSTAFIECGYEADVVCELFRDCFDQYGDEFTGDDDTSGLECDYPPQSVEEVCDYPDLSYYAGEMTGNECANACEETEGVGYLSEFDDLCGYCYCCGYEDLL